LSTLLTPVTGTVSTAPFPSVTVSVLVKVPYATGVNVTVIVQLAPAARLALQVLLSVMDGSPLKPPPTMDAEEELVLVTVTVWLGLSPIV
jgi:hypothetical protein